MFYINSQYLSAEEYSYLSSAVALLISSALNKAKSSIPFNRVKCQSQTWWFSKAVEAIRERRKTIAFACRSDEEHQVYISVSWHVLSVSP